MYQNEDEAFEDNAIPVFKKKRPVHCASVPDLDAEIDRRIVVSRKLHQHPFPTAQKVFTKLNRGQFCTQIDFAEAYLQVEVEEESKKMLTINMHRGPYGYNRLPIGVNQHTPADYRFNNLWTGRRCCLSG
ncbi:hypothetical protein RB195_009558 [Necator americanus]|uniref:Reverse transcriptase domain-containing protein n=1 Tax=Necator americanus TaxID=51031 RepID=A0ABR1CV59_NECAM